MVRDSAAALRRIALAHFARDGFAAASLQGIADEAGVSKSAVLYHYESKEALLDASLRPAVVALEDLLESADFGDPLRRRQFLDRFVDLLLDHRQAIAVLVNHGSPLSGIPVIDRADALVGRVGDRLCPPDADPIDALRFGVALAGAAFVLIAADRWGGARLPDDDLRPALSAVLAEVLGEPALGPAAAR